jgi:SAM-dependent methyltransferase
MTYDESLFAGTAAYYARYRPPYPLQLIKDIASHYGLDGKGRLLDLGCGPGTLTLPLSRYFESALAIDIDGGMIEEAKRIQQYISEFRQRTIEWCVMPAEGISPALGSFRLVTCGSSFHWMDRDLVLERIRDVLEPGCGVALVGGLSGWLDGPEQWQKVITDAVRRYLGDRRRAGNTFFEPGERFEQTLPRNGWTVEFERDYSVTLEWDLDSIMGHLWSTSFANRTLFGDRVEEFEKELRGELLELNPRGAFRETGEFGLVCGRPPA